MPEGVQVAVIGDWDADGAVSAAIVYYTQAKLGVFPLSGRIKPWLAPSGPRSLPDTIGGLPGCPEVLVILDIPYTEEIAKALRLFRGSGCSGRIYYFDHHPSTIDALPELEDDLHVDAVVGKSATAVLLRTFLAGMGVRLTPRLEGFVKAVAVLEGSRRKASQLVNSDIREEGLVQLAASISKALNRTRSADLWRSYVEWLANPLPFESPKIRLPGVTGAVDLIEASYDLGKEADEEAKQAAVDLAMGAESLGFIKFVDARGKWKKRGATALASYIHRITGQPVAVLVEKRDGGLLLVIRASHGAAVRIAEILRAMNALEDVGGHGNVATGRVPRELDVDRLKQLLRRAVFQAMQELNSRRT
ncbi:MAG: phosphoesterase [Desulfurococcales archaeon]|nr:phosphoesterase [Desulfurococcales archaeon]